MVLVDRIELPSADYQSDALPLSYTSMVGRPGLEPRTLPL